MFTTAKTSLHRKRRRPSRRLRQRGGPQGRWAKRNEPDRERQTPRDLAPTANLTAQTNEAAELVDGEEVDLQSSYHKKKKTTCHSLCVVRDVNQTDRVQASKHRVGNLKLTEWRMSIIL